MKRLIGIIIAIAVLLIPASVFAVSTVILDGTATITNSEPVVITLKSGDGTYDPVTHSWTVNITGGGTKQLVLTAKNNGTVAYTVNALVTPGTVKDGVTAAWSPAAKYIAAGDEYDFKLTITVTSDSPLGESNFSFQFTR